VNTTPQYHSVDLERATLGKVARRLLPVMFLMYVFNILDRVNITSAVLTMKPDLGFSDSVYAFGASVFFVGYFIFEVPSNVIMEKVGARVWIARIMITWGLVACSFMFVKTATHFYLVRFLLGVAEAGFFPGMMLYLTYWFPDSVRGRAASRFILANVFANIIGGPIAAQLMQLNGVAGLRGWQWLFLLEGIPTILIGIGVLFYLTDRPEKANWLKPEEREWLVNRLAEERTHREQHHHITLLQAFRYPRVLHLATIFFLNILAGSGLGIFTNLVLKERSTWTTGQILWLGSIPNIVGAIAMLIVAHFSDRSGERRKFVVAGLLVSATGMALASATHNPWLTLGALCIVGIGGWLQNAPFWALTTGFLSGSAAAGGIAFINSIGNFGSFFGPQVMGPLKDLLHNYEVGILILAGVMALASYTAYRLPPDPAAIKPAPQT
jgi:ACS family tartrate transporter-like MFS transporter